MVQPRTAIQDFAVANDAYIAAQVSFFVPDVNGLATITLATLYANLTGLTTLPNPQTLDSDGKLQQPVYIEEDVVASVSAGALSHNTGVIQHGGKWRGFYTVSTRYSRGDYIVGPVGEAEEDQIYLAKRIFDSTTWAADLAAADKLELFLDVQAISANLAQATESTKGAAEIATQAEVDASASDLPIVTPKKLGSLWRQGTDIAAANNISKPAEADRGGYYKITGNTQINTLWSGETTGMQVTFYFTGTPLIQHSSSLLLPGSVDYQVVAGDVIVFRAEATNVWRVTSIGAAGPAALETRAGKIEIATQAEVNAFTDDLRAVTPLKLHNKQAIAFRAHRNGTTQALGVNVETKVDFTNEDYDLGSYFDLSADTWTPPAGYYFVAFMFSANAAGTDGNFIAGRIKVAGNNVAEFVSRFVSNPASGCVVWQGFVNGSQAIEAYIHSQDGTDLSGAINLTAFQGHRIGAA